MWLGPVFQAELLTLSRRPRFFVGRALYGLLVLLIVGTTYHSMSRPYVNEAEIPINALASFGQAIFSSFATLQGLIILVMTPSQVAGSIAEEKQRKTLHYLMASQLSSTEIVLGKMAARLLRVAVLGAIGLPVLSLISLFGGVDFELVLLVYGATATTTFFIASVAILCSVQAPKPREAIMRTYFLELVWLAFAPILLSTMNLWSPFWLRIGEFCQPVLEWIAYSTPASLLRSLAMNRSINQLIENVCWMMGLQVVYGTILLVLATLRLRPVFRGLDGPGLWARLVRRRPENRSRLRLWARPGVGGDAMMWKEMYLHRVSDLRRVVLLLLSLVVVGSTIYSAWDVIIGAINEARTDGFWNYGSNQRVVHDLLQFVNAIAIVVALLGLGSVAASSVSSEREGDTWTNLASSPLDGAEVIRGKIVGALWLFRPLGIFLGVCWLGGVAVGSVHPVGALISVVELAVFAWFVASLGVTVSLRSKNTIQALALTIGILLLLNVGYLFFFVLIQVRTMIIFMGCMPFLFTVGLLGVDDFNQTSSGPSTEVLIASVLGTIGYALAAAFLTFHSIRSYDRVVDRPDRSRNDLTPEKLALIRKAARSSGEI